MAVQYTHKIASGSSFLSFMRLLRRWRGSVYKVVWPDMLLYTIFYTTLSLVYRLALSEDGRRFFESLVIHCARFRNLIPVSFVLGFYVSLVVSRWWETYQTFPWPDNLAILVTTHIPDLGEASREVRTTILRYVLITMALTFSCVSPEVRKEIESYEDLVHEDYLTEEEMKILKRLEEEADTKVTWVPIQWACRAVHRARQQGLVITDLGHKELVEEILKIRSKCGGLIGYDCNNIPLVYCQVVSIAVYSYFVFSVLGEQFLDPSQGYPDHNIDLYVPIFGFLQLFFYLGWMKVAEALLNPFGADDHDFDFLSLLKRHAKLSILLCDPDPQDFPSCLRQQEKPHKLHPFNLEKEPAKPESCMSCL